MWFPRYAPSCSFIESIPPTSTLFAIRDSEYIHYMLQIIYEPLLSKLCPRLFLSLTYSVFLYLLIPVEKYVHIQTKAESSVRKIRKLNKLNMIEPSDTRVLSEQSW